MCAVFELLLFEALVLFRAALLRLDADRLAVARLTVLRLVVLRFAVLLFAVRLEVLFLFERLVVLDRADGMCFSPTYSRKCDSLLWAKSLVNKRFNDPIYKQHHQ